MNISVELVTVIVGTPASRPCVMLVHNGDHWALPAGPLQQEERSLQSGTRRWVEQLTGHRLGYLEQLYTFADADREEATPGQAEKTRAISISYLALTRTNDATAMWVPWYDFLPWEDQRGEDIRGPIVAVLHEWAHGASGDQDDRDARTRRIALAFGLDGHEWVPDLALQRYELMYEAGLLAESGGDTNFGVAMTGDHRRMLATAMGRLRAKIQYRPVIFELLPQEFTLGELQRCVEAIAGQHTHTQNFRRLVEQQALVEPTGSMTSTGGRPAKLFRFREDVIDARAFAGTKLPTTRGAR